MDINPIGTVVETNGGNRGTVTRYWEEWQAPGVVRVKLDTGETATWSHCKVVNV